MGVMAGLAASGAGSILPSGAAALFPLVAPTAAGAAAGGGGFLASIGGAQGLMALAGGGVGALQAIGQASQQKTMADLREKQIGADIEAARTKGLTDSVSILNDNNRAAGAALAAMKGIPEGSNKVLMDEIFRVGELNLSGAQAGRSASIRDLGLQKEMISLSKPTAGQTALKAAAPMIQGVGGAMQSFFQRRDREESLA